MMDIGIGLRGKKARDQGIVIMIMNVQAFKTKGFAD
jgi:hypothetical protein